MQVAENMAETLAKRSPKAFEELKNLCSIVPRMDKMAALDIESSICALLVARDERKIQMNEIAKTLILLHSFEIQIANYF